MLNNLSLDWSMKDYMIERPDSDFPDYNRREQDDEEVIFEDDDLDEF